jgi:hypothetical protein
MHAVLRCGFGLLGTGDNLGIMGGVVLRVRRAMAILPVRTDMVLTTTEHSGEQHQTIRV